MRDAEVKRVSLETTFMQGLITGDSDKDLLSCVILCAIHDSKSYLESVRVPAREWLSSDKVCEFYCWLIGVDHRLMVEQISGRW